MNVTNNDMKQYAKPAGEHVSLGSTLRGVIFVIPAAVAALIFFSSASSGAVPPPVAIGAAIISAFL